MEHQEIDAHAMHEAQVSTYYKVFFALLGFTLLTTAVAFVDLGVFNNLVAMAIAVTKATLVVLFFMHVYESKPLTGVTIGMGLFWLVVMILITLSDPLTRGLMGVPGK